METPLRPIIRVKMGKTTYIITNKCFFLDSKKAFTLVKMKCLLFVSLSVCRRKGFFSKEPAVPSLWGSAGHENFAPKKG